MISKEEVLAIIDNTNNIKHKCIVSLLYSGGLRRGELINLKIVDIDIKRMLIRVEDAKGNKDRYTLLSLRVLKELRSYYKKWQPKVYLFEGPAGMKYSSRSIANIINNAAAKAGIRKNVTPHMLRHSFATHYWKTVQTYEISGYFWGTIHLRQQKPASPAGGFIHM